VEDWKRILFDFPELFITRYFGDRLEGLKPFHVRLINIALNEVRGLILYPAGHGKTTLVSTILPIFHLCKDPTTRIAIIAKNEVDAKGIMRAIHAELLSNQLLIRDFGNFKAEGDDKAWTLERIDIAQNPRVRKEGSIQMYGSKGNVLGKRFDRVICDDVVTEKNSSTSEQRQAMREWFNLGVETMPEFPGVSTLTVVGTLFHPEDLYHDLRDLVVPETGKEIYKLQLEDAVVDEENQITLWPERWTWADLMLMKAKMGPIDFNKRYRNVAVDESRLVFKHEYIWGGYIGTEKYTGCIDKDHAIGEWQENWRRVAGFDPAIGTSKEAKFSAHIILAQGSCALHERCYWIVDLVRDQLTMPQQVDLVIMKHEEYDLFASVIEINAYQMGLKETVDKVVAEQGLSFNILPHHTTRNTKPDPELGVTSMKRMVANGQLHIPWGDQYSRTTMMQFVHELEEFPGRTTDTVMALWFAWKALQEQGPRYTSYNRLERPRMSYHAKGAGRRSVQNPAYAQRVREPHRPPDGDIRDTRGD
jgi:hypothetical protein